MNKKTRKKGSGAGRNRRTDRLSKKTVMLIILSVGLVAAIVALIVLLNVWKQKPENKPEPVSTKEATVEVTEEEPTVEPEPEFTDVEFGASDYSREFFANDLIIGDSIAMGFSDYQKLDGSRVAASVSLTPYKAHAETISLPDGTSGSPLSYAEGLQPKRIILIMGHNGLNPSNGSKAMKGSYRELVEKLEAACPDTVIYCCSVTPVTADSTAASASGITNVSISAFNEYLKTLSAELGMVYLDINGKLADDSGYLNSDYEEVDGMHLAGATYDLMLSYLQRYITAAPAPEASSKAAGKQPVPGSPDTSDAQSASSDPGVTSFLPPTSSQPEESDPADTIFTPPGSLSEDYDKETFENDLFIGDSITTGLYLYNVLSPKNVAAAVGYTPYKAYTTEIELGNGTTGTALDYATSMQPKRIFLMLGSNGIAAASSMEDSYRTLIEKLQDKCPDSEIFCISVTPVTSDSTSAASAGITNTMITDFNKFVKSLAEEKELTYIDLYSLLSDENGFFLPDYAEKDGLHFKGATYRVMLAYIESLL